MNILDSNVHQNWNTRRVEKTLSYAIFEYTECLKGEIQPQIVDELKKIMSDSIARRCLPYQLHGCDRVSKVEQSA